MKLINSECVKEVFGTEMIHFKNLNPFDCQEMSKFKSNVVCFSVCLARKLDLIDEDGDLIEEEIRANVNATVHGMKWKNADVDNIIDTCMDEATSGEDEGECSLVPLKLHVCVWKRFMEACPAKLQIKNQACNNMREFVFNNAEKMFFEEDLED